VRLWLTREQARAITDHAQQAFPHEACGLIGGRKGNATAVFPMTNVSNNPRTAYQIEPSEQVAAMMALQRDQLDLLAIYHSHPTTRSLPSQTDIREATYPNAAYLIISLAADTPRLAAWQIRQGEVTPVDLVVSDTPPPKHHDPALTTGQKTAIVVAGILATVLLITYSILLLPPPPPIPTPGG
jgi:[CysO sulfur-carrier protein]-S-L-cysteine hydrolase